MLAKFTQCIEWIVGANISTKPSAIESLVLMAPHIPPSNIPNDFPISEQLKGKLRYLKQMIRKERGL